MIGEMDENGGDDTEKTSSQPLLSSSSSSQQQQQQQHIPDRHFQPITTQNEENPTEITSDLQFQKSKSLHRCKTAPAIDRSAIFRELQAQFKTQAQSQAQSQAQTSSENPPQKEDDEDEEEQEVGSSGMLMVKQAVGYGDRAFNTLTGRLFASVWLLVSTLAVARAFLYLVEARIHKRQRTIAKWVLQRDITPSDLFAANINNNDHLNKSEYVLFKLKEMGKIGQQEILQICNQFEKLDSNYMGRITPPDLFQNRPSPIRAESLA